MVVEAVGQTVRLDIAAQVSEEGGSIQQLKQFSASAPTHAATHTPNTTASHTSGHPGSSSPSSQAGAPGASQVTVIRGEVAQSASGFGHIASTRATSARAGTRSEADKSNDTLSKEHKAQADLDKAIAKTIELIMVRLVWQHMQKFQETLDELKYDD